MRNTFAAEKPVGFKRTSVNKNKKCKHVEKVSGAQNKNNMHQNAKPPTPHPPLPPPPTASNFPCSNMPFGKDKGACAAL